ncbi:MAG: methyl-accepting chemotaxis protein [Deltaproteobacteria bacterium]|nr:methyl-accepting chemotaxis protein [Deltaproteobacteria bacterium]
MTERHRRKKYSIVDRSHQYKFLALVLTYNMAIVLFLGVSLFVPDILRLQDPNIGLEARALAAGRILSMHARVWPAVIALICLFGMHSFRVFHRFIGPLVRFRWAFDEIRNGNLSFRVKLRKKDYLHREEETFNAMLETLAGKIGRVQGAAGEAYRSLQEMAGHGAEGGPGKESMGVALGDLQDCLSAIVENARYFRVEDGPVPAGEQRPLPDSQAS